MHNIIFQQTKRLSVIDIMIKCRKIKKSYLRQNYETFIRYEIIFSGIALWPTSSFERLLNSYATQCISYEIKNQSST